MRFRKVLLVFIAVVLTLGCSCRKSPSKETFTGVSECSELNSFESNQSDYVSSSAGQPSSEVKNNKSSEISSPSSKLNTSSDLSSASSVKSESSCTTKSYSSKSTKSPAVTSSTEKRAVWISYLEYMKILTGKTETQFKKSISEMFDKCASFGLNTVIVQARGHADAYYKSNLFPSSLYFTGKRQNTYPFDPLSIMVNEAHRKSLKIEAWVNPYRGNKVKDEFAKNDIVKKWLGTDKVFSDGTYYYLNPGEPEVKQLVINGVMEIVNNYDVDGIHFDDYFYPGTDESYDFETYKKYGKGKTVNQFRTNCVNDTVSSVYKEIKKRKNISFGISPAGNIQSCMDIYCSDVKLWCSKSGYVDYIAPQLYWDYGEGTLPFDKALAEWNSIIKNSNVKLVAGLAAYKVGDPVYSPYWNSGNILAKQVTDARKSKNYVGFSLFRYEYFFNDTLLKERNNLKKSIN